MRKFLLKHSKILLNFYLFTFYFNMRHEQWNWAKPGKDSHLWIHKYFAASNKTNVLILLLDICFSCIIWAQRVAVTMPTRNVGGRRPLVWSKPAAPGYSLFYAFKSTAPWNFQLSNRSLTNNSWLTNLFPPSDLWRRMAKRWWSRVAVSFHCYRYKGMEPCRRL